VPGAHAAPARCGAHARALGTPSAQLCGCARRCASTSRASGGSGGAARAALRSRAPAAAARACAATGRTRASSRAWPPRCSAPPRAVHGWPRSLTCPQRRLCGCSAFSSAARRRRAARARCRWAHSTPRRCCAGPRAGPPSCTPSAAASTASWGAAATKTPRSPRRWRCRRVPRSSSPCAAGAATARFCAPTAACGRGGWRPGARCACACRSTR
jgi:hypothetical protein